MNPRIEKLEREIEKTKTKIADLQGKLRDMEKQKTELQVWYSDWLKVTDTLTAPEKPSWLN